MAARKAGTLRKKTQDAKHRIKSLLRRKNTVAVAKKRSIPLNKGSRSGLKKKDRKKKTSRRPAHIQPSRTFRVRKAIKRPIVIAISGTPGTGKTIVAQKIEKEYGILHLDVNSIVKEYALSEGYDPVRRCEIIDISKLCRALIIIISKANRPIIIDSHLSHYLPKTYVDLCIITRCSPKTLDRRLSKRGYHKDKIRENLDSEIFEVCLSEAVRAGHDIIVLDTETGIDLTEFRRKLRILNQLPD
jgi:adenylate kinase